MSTSSQPKAVVRRSPAVTALWAVLVAGLSAVAWLVWLSWAIDQPELAAWQLAGVMVTLLGAVVVGVLRVGPVRAWVLATLPFAAFGAYSIFGSDPLGLIGAAVWVVMVVVGVSVMTGVVVVVQEAVLSRRGVYGDGPATEGWGTSPPASR